MTRRTHRLFLAADLIAAALVLVAVAVFATGGFRTHVGAVRISIRSPERVLLWAVLLFIARRFFGPRRTAWSVLVEAAAARGPLASGERQLFAAAGARSRLGVIRELAAVTLFCSGLTIAMTWPQIARLDHVPDLGDPLFSTWRVAWVAHQLVTDPLHLFDGNIFYPERRTLTYSDATIVSGMMAAPLLWIGVPPIVAYTLTFLAGFALSGVAMYWLVRALTGARSAAVVAAAMFTVYPYRFEHYSHLELQMTMWAPLALWGLHRTLTLGRLRDGLLTGAMFALQTLASLYYALFGVLYLGVAAAALWLGGRRPRGAIRALAAGGALAAMVVAPVATAYIRNQPVFGERPYDAVAFYSAEGRDYLVPSHRNILYRGWRGESHPERELFPGLVPVALAAIGAWPPASAAKIAYVCGLAVAFDGSLGANGILYPRLYRYVSPFRSLRVPARFSLFVGLSLVVLSGYAVARLTARRRPAAAAVIAGAIVAAVSVEARPELRLEPVWREPPGIYAAIGADAPAVLFEWPLPRDWREFWFDARYEYFSVFHWNSSSTATAASRRRPTSNSSSACASFRRMRRCRIFAIVVFSTSPSTAASRCRISIRTSSRIWTAGRTSRSSRSRRGRARRRACTNCRGDQRLHVSRMPHVSALARTSLGGRACWTGTRSGREPVFRGLADLRRCLAVRGLVP